MRVPRAALAQAERALLVALRSAAQ